MHAPTGRHVMPAILEDTWEDITAAVEALHEDTPIMQIDVMDGAFVPPQNFPYPDLHVPLLPYADEVFYEVHLMVEDPEPVADVFIDAGAARIVAHIESFPNAETASDVFAAWRGRGVGVGVSLMLDTPLDHVTPPVETGEVDVVQVMAIAKVGYQGQQFDERALARIRELSTTYGDVTISVDGGVKLDNIAALADAGATLFGVGSAIVKQDNPRAALRAFQGALT